jgi:hypothetical protein
VDVSKDEVAAVKWWRKAAEQGNAPAQYHLGLAYSIGEGVPQDYAEAARWYRKAAEQGHAAAQYNLALQYHFGEGVPQDYIQEAAWIRKAAEQGKDYAQWRLVACRRVTITRPLASKLSWPVAAKSYSPSNSIPI